MTISYSKEVATSNFSCFLKLLARWKGSIYKLLWKDFILFAFIYFLLNFSYRFVLPDNMKENFEMVSKYFDSNTSRIPLAFILGFYVTLIMTRWWNQLGLIPWPDHMAMFVTANVQGLDERGRLMRRTMVRYVCLAFTITMSCISPAVRKRFPTFDHIVAAGIMTNNEKDILNKMNTPYGNFFIPLAWNTSLANRARKECRIRDDYALKTLIDEINEFRRCLATLFVYDWISVPLVYTQVVTLAVYTFFIASLMGKQFISSKTDMFFPLFTFLEFLFYMGWLKVAECLVNPFGEDEDDFDVNFLIDRNLNVAYTIVDEVHSDHPDLIKDKYWEEAAFEMPYTIASEKFRTFDRAFLGSALDLNMSAKDREMVLPMLTLETIGELDLEEGAEENNQHPPFTQSRTNSTLMSRQSSDRSGSKPSSFKSKPESFPMTSKRKSRPISPVSELQFDFDSQTDINENKKDDKNDVVLNIEEANKKRTASENTITAGSESGSPTWQSAQSEWRKSLLDNFDKAKEEKV